jgi:hypothetical protein
MKAFCAEKSIEPIELNRDKIFWASSKLVWPGVIPSQQGKLHSLFCSISSSKVSRAFFSDKVGATVKLKVGVT